MSNRLSYIYRSIIPVLALLCGGLAYGQTNTPNTTQQTVAGSVTNTVPIPRASTPWGIQIVTQLVPKYRDTASAQITVLSAADKVALKTTALSGQGAVTYVAQRRTDGTLIVQPSDVRYMPDAYNFQAYPASAYFYELDPIYKSTQYHNGTLYPSEGGTEVSTAGLSASMVRNTSSSTERSSTAYAPGRSRIGQGRGTKTSLVFNDANTGSGLPQASIRIWDIGSGVPQANGYYAANALKGSLITTAQGGEKLVLEDREGKPVYEASLISNSPKTYARTYYVYDEMGRLRYVLPPKAVEALEAASGVVSTAIVNELCFSYFYDTKGRQHSVHKPGENGYTELVYNKEGQVIMRRNPIEKTKTLWEVIFYDRPGRVIATAILTNSESRDSWQTAANSESNGSTTGTINYYLWGTGRYTYPGTVTGLDIQSLNYYDNYDATHALSAENFSTPIIEPYLSSATNAELFYTSGSTYGLQTYSSIKVIKAHASVTNLQDWTYSKTFYDKERRPIYTVSQHAKGGKDTSAMQYSYTGQVLVTAHGHQYLNGSGPAFREWYRNTYDAQTGALSLSEHKVNNIAWQVMSSNTYDAMGRVASTTYGANAETQNFNYNIRGELQGINENFALTGNNGGQSITFGEALRYDYGYDSLRYDALAAGMIWRGSAAGNMGAHSYGYVYDAAGRMLSGAYSRSNAGYVMPTSWSNSSQDYSETVTYDQGGNILSLKRMAVVAANQMVYPTTVDNLTYTYNANSNKLRKVTDAITAIFNRGDFVNNPSYGSGYNYDEGGNVARDSTKGIISSNITYTYFNKPSFITFNPSGRLYYSYDAAGNKLQEYINYNNGPRMNYIGVALYKNDTLQSISTPVGRTDMTKSVPQEQYFVKDHLGNVRSVVADAIGSGGIGNLAAQQQTYNATYETSNLNQEEQTFDQVAVLSEDKPESTSSTDSKAALLTTGNTSTPNVGTTLLLKVMAGDKLSLNADNYYESTESNSSNVSGSSFEQVVNSLAQAAGQLSGTEGTIASDWAAQMLNSSSLQQAYDALQASATDPNKPKAYLSYLFFDEQMQLVPEYSRIWQADGAGNWSRIGTDATETLEVPQSGYVATYISTQSAEPTYFDNLAVTLQPGVLLEEKHYYPYGLPIVGMGSTSSGMLPNKNRYQGNEYREDVGLNWMDFYNRQYDPQLGRFMGIDPMADEEGQQTMSPYHAMACNPSTMVDPLGLAPQYTVNLSNPNVNMAPAGLAFVEGQAIMFGANLLGGGVSDMMKSIQGSLDAAQEVQKDQKNQKLWAAIVEAHGGTYLNGKKVRGEIPTLGSLLPEVVITGKRGDYSSFKGEWYSWGSNMNAKYGQSLGYNFEGYAADSDPWARAAKNGYMPIRADATGISIPLTIVGVSGFSASFNVGFVGNEFGAWINYGANVGSPEMSLGMGLFMAEYKGSGVPTINNYMGYGRTHNVGFFMFSGSYSEGLNNYNDEQPLWQTYQAGISLSSRELIPGLNASYNYSPLNYSTRVPLSAASYFLSINRK